MKALNKIIIHLPEITEDHISLGLTDLSKELSKRIPGNQVHGLLGGEFGYGQDYENDVFFMFPYYWDECNCGCEEKWANWEKENNHSSGCYQKDLEKVEEKVSSVKDKEIWELKVKEICKKHGIDWDGGKGCAVHCSCEHEINFKKFDKQNPHLPECLIIRPNFLYKSNNYKVSWYKYIGRDMEYGNISKPEWGKIIDHCIKSIAVSL